VFAVRYIVVTSAMAWQPLTVSAILYRLSHIDRLRLSTFTYSSCSLYSLLEGRTKYQAVQEGACHVAS